MANKIVIAAVTITVAVVCIGSLLMPVLNDATDNTVVMVNESNYRMSPLGTGTLVITYENDEYVVNDKTFPRDGTPITQNQSLMIYGVAHSTRSGYIYTITDDGYHRYNLSRDGKYTITYDGTAKTATIEAELSGTTSTTEYTILGEVYYADPAGAYVWKAELTEDTDIYIGADWVGFNAWSDGTTHFYSVMGETVTIDGTVDEGAVINATLEAIPHITGIQKLTAYSILPTGAEDPIDCRGFILPRTITGTTDMSLKDYSAVLFAIPIIAIIALLIIAVGMVARKNE